MIGRFTKKPVTIEALQWTGENHRYVRAFLGYMDRDENNAVPIVTLEGTMRADVGDWIIRGVKGEFYPCKPDVFDATYAAGEASVPETAKELVDAAVDRVREVQGDSREPWSREMALAITHLEDAQMRFSRGMAMRIGVFAPFDFERAEDPEFAKARLAERDARAAEASS